MLEDDLILSKDFFDFVEKNLSVYKEKKMFYLLVYMYHQTLIILKILILIIFFLTLLVRGDGLRG